MNKQQTNVFEELEVQGANPFPSTKEDEEGEGEGLLPWTHNLKNTIGCTGFQVRSIGFGVAFYWFIDFGMRRAGEGQVPWTPILKKY